MIARVRVNGISLADAMRKGCHLRRMVLAEGENTPKPCAAVVKGKHGVYLRFGAALGGQRLCSAELKATQEFDFQRMQCSVALWLRKSPHGA
eukprot:6049214-Pleurochrysis_carterae.AAC.3